MSVAHFCTFIGAYLGEVQSMQVGTADIFDLSRNTVPNACSDAASAAVLHQPTTPSLLAACSHSNGQPGRPCHISEGC
jgi:hypothetical protein